MSFQPAMPWRVALPQSPPPFHRPGTPAYNDGHNPAQRFSANGETLLSRLSRFGGPPRSVMQLEAMERYDFFLSYAHEDQHIAAELAGRLTRHGWSVWWDRDLRLGDLFDRQIENKMHCSAHVLVIWSDKSFESDWVRAEAAYALRKRKLISTKVSDDSSLPVFCENVHTVLIKELSNEALEDLITPRRSSSSSAAYAAANPAMEISRDATTPTSPRRSEGAKGGMSDEPAAAVAGRLLRSVRESPRRGGGLVGSGDDCCLTPAIRAYRETADEAQLRGVLAVLARQMLHDTASEAREDAGLAAVGLIGDRFPGPLMCQTVADEERNTEYLRSLDLPADVPVDRVLAFLNRVEYERWW